MGFRILVQVGLYVVCAFGAFAETPPAMATAKISVIFHGTAGSIQNVASDGKNIYWTEGGLASNPNAVYAISTNGGPRTLLSKSTFPHGIAVSNGVVYWSDFTEGNISSIPATGGKRTIVAKAYQPSHLFIVDKYLFWQNSTALMKITLPNGEPEKILETNFSGLTGPKMTLVGDRLYWISGPVDDKTLWNVDIHGGAPQQVMKISDNVLNLINDGKNLYFSEWNSGNISSLPVNGKAAHVIATGVAPYEMVIEGPYLYWINGFQPGLGRVSLVGGTPQVLATYPGSFLGNALMKHNHTLYWIITKSDGNYTFYKGTF